MKRVVLAFFVAPIVPLLVLGLIDVARSSGLQPSSGNAKLFAVIMFLYVYPTTAIVGVPAFLLYRRRGWYQWWRVALGGALVGFAPSLLALALVLFVDMRLGEFMATWLPFAALGAGFGAVGALAFRLLAFPLRWPPSPPHGTDVGGARTA